MSRKGFLAKGSTGRSILFLSISAILIAGALYAGWYYIIRPQAVITIPVTGEFDITVWDGSAGIELSENDFDYTLYGVDDDISDFVSYEEIESGSDLGRISSGDLEDYDYFVIRCNGTVAEEDFDDNYGDRTYYERWFQIWDEIDNTIIMYQSFTEVNFSAFESESFDYLDLSAVNITFEQNFTLIVAGNESQDDAMYVRGSNYENEIDDAPNFIVEANDTIALSDLSISGCTKSRVNSTSIRYSFERITNIPTSLVGKWNDETVDLELVSIQLFFGDTILA